MKASYKLHEDLTWPTISKVPNADAQFSNVCPTSSIKFTSNPPAM